MFANRNKPEAGITLIANNCELTGDVHFSDQLLVNGVVSGNIYAREGSKAVVTVSEKGCVNGDIRVPSVIVNGKVTGDIHSDRHVELAAKAEVKGDVYYNLIEMVRGSRVDGNFVHIGADKEAKQETYTPSREETPRIEEAEEEDATSISKPAVSAFHTRTG
jgi:cytoskeletal protein CcmA (bactofilin family)